MTDAAESVASSGRRRKSGAATIYDIAEAAGVNPSTVSRALNQPGRVSAKTEARIRAAADELHFQINPLARALPTGRTNTIALIVADITNPVVFETIRGAERAASIAGYTLVISESQESGAVEANTVERITPAVDGVILGTTRLPDKEIVRLAERKPLITLNREVKGIPHLASDPSHGAQQLVDHLDELGHRSIAFLGGPSRSWMSSRRWEALLHAARSHGIAIFEIGPHSPTLAGGAAAFERAEASGATAVVAYNDLVAIGLIQEATRRGLRVPDDLSVAGFDDIFAAELITPPLTTVRSDLRGLGSDAVRHLLRTIGVGEPVDGTADVTTELVVRGSTGTVRQN
ncbi:LacI family DNA-binding transcriptional regulator [Demequina sp. NBRC 110057]|uniref:LacI family DNA-binding transcriptional regulator n=1 Tax=Demequina sp. NBRC 110057 TaxID=1570346 RepID=UPI001177B5B4|nr:LacI family DNA-binding transcriptional regulator [Demequina sp. NBRC 110057]